MQPQNRPGLPAQGGFSTILDLQFASLGRQIPRCLVHTNHALQDQTDEEGRKDVAGSPRPPAQLVPGKRGDRPGLRGRFQQQGQGGHQAILWVSHL